AYENLKSQSKSSMNKVLQQEQSADDFFKVPNLTEGLAFYVPLPQWYVIYSIQLPYPSTESFREMNKYFIMLLITFFCTLITLLIAIVHVSVWRRMEGEGFGYSDLLHFQVRELTTIAQQSLLHRGGRRLLSDQLKACKESIKYKAFPFCCCGCLPVVAPSVRNIRKLENFISQSCRIVLQVADICAMRETGKTHNWWFVSSYVFSFITMTAALYFSFVVFNLNRDTKNKSRYNYLFYMVNISQILYTAQRYFLKNYSIVI
ncbi:hypothetical protein PMAYCL1PPCAC_02615, partial [Pristionchus mayeri]